MGNFKRSLSLLLAFIILNFPITFAESTSFAEPFSDVNEGNPYFVSINYLKENGTIEGYEDNTFKPSQDINRGEALKMLTIASGIISEDEIANMEETEERPFQDTPVSEWYTKYLIAAKEKGIIGGYEDGTFKPWKNINLAETLKIFLESYSNIDYSNLESLLIDDVPPDDWFSKYVLYAVSKGLINIYSTNTVSPQQTMTRGYMAEIIYRMQKSLEGYEFGKATWYGGINDGDNTLTAAHKYLPFDSVVEVTNLSNGKSVNVTITDRGPYGPGRVIDLSDEAFSEIASLGAGVIYVQYKVIHLP